MLEIANLEVVYNEVILVLRGLSIEVRDGQIVALLGANGAGKTTVTRAVTGLLDVHEGKITKGSVTLEGRRIDADDPSAIVRSGITQVMCSQNSRWTRTWSPAASPTQTGRPSPHPTTGS